MILVYPIQFNTLKVLNEDCNQMSQKAYDFVKTYSEELAAIDNQITILEQKLDKIPSPQLDGIESQDNHVTLHVTLSYPNL